MIASLASPLQSLSDDAEDGDDSDSDEEERSADEDRR
jgi:hypothetical protein